MLTSKCATENDVKTWCHNRSLVTRKPSSDAQADLRLCCSHRAKTGFLMTRFISRRHPYVMHKSCLTRLHKMSCQRLRCLLKKYRELDQSLDKEPEIWPHWISGWLSRCIWAATWQNQQNECAPSKDSNQPGHPPSLIRVFAVRMKKLRSLAIHWVHSLIWVFAGCTVILLVLSCRGSFEESLNAWG